MDNVEVRGTLWLVESLVKHTVITKEQAHEAYEKMKQCRRRLPWNEAHQRIDDL